MTMASTEEALVGIWFDDQIHFGATLQVPSEEKPAFVMNETKRWLDAYFSGRIPDFVPRLDLRGTPFRIQVCENLLSIPYGKTRTYKELACEIARQRGLPSMSAQAIGGAVSHNPISLILPCHRVIGSHGDLTGYAGGIERKKWLLDWERRNVF